VLSSETSSFDLIEADYIREVEPGEIVVIHKGGLTSHRIAPPTPTSAHRFCVFEHVYFARPDSLLNGKSVYRAREKMGKRLAIEAPVEADVVIPVPDSGVPSAIGYANQANIPFEMGLIRSHYVGRTFIEPQDSIRHFGVRLKLSVVRSIVDGRRVVVVDDSLVRGTTSRKIVKMLRDAGAREVHMRISAPPTTHPCYYGIDTPNRSELIASSHSVDEIARYITCDTLAYLSHDGMMAAVNAPQSGDGYCSACFTGNYPVPLGKPDEGALVKLRLNRV
jgi:amidophosphoribosyltransferase